MLGLYSVAWSAGLLGNELVVLKVSMTAALMALSWVVLMVFSLAGGKAVERELGKAEWLGAKTEDQTDVTEVGWKAIAKAG